MIRQDKKHATKVLVPCSWHATDLIAPVEVKSIQNAIKDAKKIVKFFKYRHRPKVMLRMKREKANKDKRATEGSTIKHIPTLKVRVHYSNKVHNDVDVLHTDVVVLYTIRSL